MNKITRPPRAVSYARFSSGKQAKGSSIERQNNAFLVWLEQHREYETLSFEDRGISAFKGKNASKGGLADLLSLIHRGDLQSGDSLVIESMDRLSRQEVSESLGLVQDILRAGITIVTLEDHQIYDKSSLNDSRGFVLLANLQAAHNYSKRLGDRVRAAHETKRIKARSRTVPSKLVTASWIRDGKLLEPFASLVKKAAGLYLSGYGHRAIVKELQSLIDSEPDLKARYDRPIHATTVKRWLKSAALVGDWESKDGLIEGIFEPLLTHAEFQRLQKELSRRSLKPSKQRTYLLSGLVVCAACDSSFHTRTQKPRPTRAAPVGSELYAEKPPILYCNCSNYLKNGTCNNNTTWPYEVLLFILMYGLAVPLIRNEDMGQAKYKSVELEKLSDELEENKAKMQRFEDLYVATGNKTHLDRVLALKAENEGISAKIGEVTEKVVSQLEQDEITRAFQVYNKLSVVEQNALLRRMEHFVIVDGKHAALEWSFTNPEFELIRRSQKYGVYILKVTNDSEDGNRQQRFFAVGRKGETLFTDNFLTEQSLLEKLEQVESGESNFFVHVAMYE